jgi:predicted small lipoprotein YifL
MRSGSFRTATILLGMFLLATMLALASCGKKGPPDQPGPPSEVIFPRTYPTH